MTIEINQSMLLEFNKVLDQGLVTSLYQPIVDLHTGDIFGYEALSRGPENSILNSPLVLLSVAELLNKTWELERLLRVKAIEHARFTDKYALFLNVDPNVVKDPKFKSGFTKENLKKFGIAPEAIVLELTERSAIESYEDFKVILNHYKDQGYQIAIDDVGSGYSGLKTLYEVYPKYLKIDMDFIRNIDSDKFKQSIVNSFIEIAKLSNMKTVAEGIETENELRTLIKMGIDYGQGYFIQRPNKEVIALDLRVTSIIDRENKLVNRVNNYSQEYHYIHHIMKPVDSFDRVYKCKVISDYFKQTGHTSIAVVSNDQPIGLVTQNEINRVFATQYGYSVYSHRQIDLVMDKAPLIVDAYTPINEVAKLALNRPNDSIYDDIIVCLGRAYAGIVTMKELLDYAINYEKNHAKELNPLTGLPGNKIINRVMKSAIEMDKRSCIIYADLDNFKVFNDVYGFEKGDQILIMTAEILKKAIDKYMPYNTFLGHIGGDDFIIATDSDIEIIQAFCTFVISDFDKGMRSHLRPEDLKRGHLIGKNRQGLTTSFNLTSISLAGLIAPMDTYQTVELLGSELATIKKEVKKVDNSSYLINEKQH